MNGAKSQGWPPTAEDESGDITLARTPAPAGSGIMARTRSSIAADIAAQLHGSGVVQLHHVLRLLLKTKSPTVIEAMIEALRDARVIRVAHCRVDIDRYSEGGVARAVATERIHEQMADFLMKQGAAVVTTVEEGAALQADLLVVMR